MRCFTKLVHGAVLIVGLFVSVARGAPASLAQLFERGPIFQDRNGDGVIDFVNARMVLGENPTAAEVAAAASIAARLGFETSALNLPWASTDGAGEIAIIVGPSGLKRAGIEAPQLKPGEGIVSMTELSGKAAVIVAGADEAGTLAAAELLAGRLPHAWDPKGPTLEKVAEELRGVLAGAGVRAGAISVPSVYTAAGVDAIARIELSAEFASPADVGRAANALRALLRAPQASGERPLSYGGAQAVRVRLSASGATPVQVELPRAKPPAGGPLGPRPGAAAKADLDLSNLYTNDGLLGDSDGNLIPDRVDALLSPSGEGTVGTVDLAARMGLESAGVSLPAARPGASLGKPEEEPTLVLVGIDHPLIDQLVKAKKWERPALEPGQGWIEVVRKAFGDKSALIVTASDPRGLRRALSEVAERFPHIWERGKDRTTLDDVEEEMRKFLSGRSPAGQAAMALYKLELLGKELSGKDLASVQVRLYLEKAQEGLADLVRREASSKIKADALEVTVENRDVQKAPGLFDQEFDIPSEVDDFWQLFRTRVLKAVKKGKPVVVEARLSEPPELRSRIEQEAEAQLLKAGAASSGTSVTVLSAYKQGYSWLYDVVRPAIAGREVGEIRIRFAEIGAPPEWKQQAMYPPTRWLLELYPIDEVLARELKVDLKQIRFEKMPVGSPAYEAIVTGRDGAEIFRQTFNPRFVVRPFFSQFPDYEKVRVTTGWLAATVEGRPVVDERIVTDPERFWDHFQSKILTAIYDQVMTVSRGKPRADDAPFFGELAVELSLSEPNYPLGVDKEQIASLESVAEEIYFNTLHFFEVLGRTARGPGFRYPGRIIPRVHPRADGKAGHARIRFSGFGASRPAVVVGYRERSGAAGELRLDLWKIALERPSAVAALVRDGRNGVERLDLRVKVNAEKNERAELIQRARAEQVDRQVLSAEQVAAVLGFLGRLRDAGLYRDALAYHDLGALRVIAQWEYESSTEKRVSVSLHPNGAPAPFPDIRKLLPSGYRHSGGAIVQWDTPIPPPEAYEILAKMSTFKEATVYKVGESYLGKDVWAMDLMPPLEASHWSQAKASTLKPTIVYSARQHANEVSSTSHVLKLAELLLTDADFRKKLEKVNVVIHPITNADGAQLAYDLYRDNPDYMHHAGYLGSLGVDVEADMWKDDPIYPESSIRPKIWRNWLPDIFLNPHGYPSHEWVQLFSEYAAWVLNRVTESRDWWAMRGWFVPGFNYLDDPNYPGHKDAAFQIRSLITRNINAAPEVRALNERAYDRYRRYGPAWDQENFHMDLTNGVLVYTALRGEKANPTSEDFMARHPKVTLWTGVTEAPDETAHGDWMKLAATAGLQWDKAILEYLETGNHVVERKREPFYGGASLSLSRARPPKPKEEPRPTSPQ